MITLGGDESGRKREGERGARSEGGEEKLKAEQYRYFNIIILIII